MWILTLIAAFSLLQAQQANGCCRRVKRACASNWLVSRYQDLDSNPELPVVDGRCHRQQQQQLIRQERIHLSDPVHYFGVGLFAGIAVTVMINKFLYEIKDC